MKKKDLNIVRIITTSLAKKQMLQEVIDNVKDKVLFEDKKEAILSCVDVEKSKEGDLKVSLI